MGTFAVAAGWSWGFLLLVLFVIASSLSRYREGYKERRLAPIIEKGGRRNAWQIAANGAAFTIAAIGSILFPSLLWNAFGIGAIATSAADTWATEVGTLSGKPPRSILTGRPVPTGTSGGISLSGCIAGVAGAVLIGIIAVALGWPKLFLYAAVIGGVGGALLDSVAGALCQDRRWCDTCGVATERIVHSCGAATRHAGGLSWLDNDAVNAVTTFAGGGIGLLVGILW